jgi:peroxiredoxin Q/BCP
MKVAVGDDAPDFTLTDQDGAEWSLAAHRGAPVVLYFFPRADTPGCTTQACDVRDHWAEFSSLGAEVVGISADKQQAMARFAGKYGLPHRLLGDPDRQVIDAYGGAKRSSLVIDRNGKVAAVFDPIKANEQSEKALAAVRAL